ncbi:coiled-coil domain-containing protein 137 [Sorex araneus]|uniref:coiled-coil domain-containing protein 137 n=1 Tax=Sorex araneus TaxID=42254 RepID=UPI0024335818|nr:coiled-coil domain-containing protein 137 [Sorex araneus]
MSVRGGAALAAPPDSPGAADHPRPSSRAGPRELGPDRAPSPPVLAGPRAATVTTRPAPATLRSSIAAAGPARTREPSRPEAEVAGREPGRRCFRERGMAGGRRGAAARAGPGVSGDEQGLPFRLREIMRGRQEVKARLSGRRRRAAQAALRRTLEEEAKGTEPDIPVPKFKRRKGESDRAFVQRMEQEAQHVLFLSRNQARCQPEAPAAPKKSEGKKAFQKRRLDRIRQQRVEKVAERLERELLQDTVKFGDIVQQPPELTARPRASTSVSQPGRKPLLLRRCLSPAGAGETRSPDTSPARQRILGAERERAVLAYRALKRQRQAAEPLR